MMLRNANVNYKSRRLNSYATLRKRKKSGRLSVKYNDKYSSAYAC